MLESRKSDGSKGVIDSYVTIINHAALRAGINEIAMRSRMRQLGRATITELRFFPVKYAAIRENGATCSKLKTDCPLRQRGLSSKIGSEKNRDRRRSLRLCGARCSGVSVGSVRPE